MTEKEKIRPLYKELQGLLSQAPVSRKEVPDDVSQNLKELQYFHTIIGKLKNIILGEDLSRFYLKAEKGAWGEMFRINEYRQKVNGLIMFLHALYFDDESQPFSGSPHTVVTQQQDQSQKQDQVQSISQRRIYYIAIGISITVSIAVSFLFNLVIKLFIR